MEADGVERRGLIRDRAVLHEQIAERLRRRLQEDRSSRALESRSAAIRAARRSDVGAVEREGLIVDGDATTAAGGVAVAAAVGVNLPRAGERAGVDADAAAGTAVVQTIRENLSVELQRRRGDAHDSAACLATRARAVAARATRLVRIVE